MGANGRRHRVVIEQATGTPDAAGQLIPTWRTFADADAQIDPIASSERIRAGEQIGVLTHRVRLPFIDGVTRDMRLRFGSRVLNIHSITVPGERRRELDLLCEEAT